MGRSRSIHNRINRLDPSIQPPPEPSTQPFCPALPFSVQGTATALWIQVSPTRETWEVMKCSSERCRLQSLCVQGTEIIFIWEAAIENPEEIIRGFYWTEWKEFAISPHLRLWILDLPAEKSQRAATTRKLCDKFHIAPYFSEICVVVFQRKACRTSTSPCPGLHNPFCNRVLPPSCETTQTPACVQLELQCGFTLWIMQSLSSDRIHSSITKLFKLQSTVVGIEEAFSRDRYIRWVAANKAFIVRVQWMRINQPIATE